jgi:hypothetical protein
MTLAPGARCTRCGRVTHNPDDLLNGYCGNCHLFTTLSGPFHGELDPPRSTRDCCLSEIGWPHRLGCPAGRQRGMTWLDERKQPLRARWTLRRRAAFAFAAWAIAFGITIACAVFRLAGWWVFTAWLPYLVVADVTGLLRVPGLHRGAWLRYRGSRGSRPGRRSGS